MSLQRSSSHSKQVSANDAIYGNIGVGGQSLQFPHILKNLSLASLQSQPTFLQQRALQNKSVSGLSPQNSTRFTKKLVRVVNGKISVVQPEGIEDQTSPAKQSRIRNASLVSQKVGVTAPTETSTQLEAAAARKSSQQPRILQSRSTMSLIAQPSVPSHLELELSQQQQQQQSLQQQTQSLPTSQSQLDARELNEAARCGIMLSKTESDIDASLSLNEIHNNHFRGTCICHKCTCGMHFCVIGRNSHKTRLSKMPQHSIYKISYVKKGRMQGGNVDHGMYENMKSNTQTIDVDSIAHTDFCRPDQDNYLHPTASFKPVRKFELSPLQVGRSHYRRDFLEWGCAPYQPIKAYSNRTTMEAMPFHGATTYAKDFTNDTKVTRPVLINKNHETTISKSAIPFLGVTTSQEFFKPFKSQGVAAKFKAQDELITGAPSFLGQFQTLASKDYKGLQRPRKQKNGVTETPISASVVL